MKTPELQMPEIKVELTFSNTTVTELGISNQESPAQAHLKFLRKLSKTKKDSKLSLKAL